MKSLLAAFLLTVTLHGADRPNIVLLFADDWGRHASAYAALDGPGSANDIIRTPNFDSIAKEGVFFRNAFVSSPSSPERSPARLRTKRYSPGANVILYQPARATSLIPSAPSAQKTTFSLSISNPIAGLQAIHGTSPRTASRLRMSWKTTPT